MLNLLQADSMKNRKTRRSQPKSRFAVLSQICKLIPSQLVSKLAREHGCEQRARTFSPWSHVVTLLYGQLTRALSLNDICDALRNHVGKLSAIRGATAPARNTFSNANRTRDPKMMEALLWKMLDHFHTQSPNFGGRSRYAKLPKRFKRVIHAVDSTTIALVANCIDWAKHRRRKAAAKCHLRLNMQDMLPRFAVVDTAKDSDAKRAWEVCAGIKSGEIVVFDKAYVDFDHLYELTTEEITWITRAKDNMSYRVVKKRQRKAQGKILEDNEIVLMTRKSKELYPVRLRRIKAKVIVDGKEKIMVFITNNLELAASSICELYRCRWAIEVFFKELKQCLQLCDFIGHNEKAVKWQIWAALLSYVLLRYLAYLSDWKHSFTRIWTMVRGVLWSRYDLLSLLRSYGTANGSFRVLGQPEQAYLPGLTPI
jgi:hypothetical protein